MKKAYYIPVFLLVVAVIILSSCASADKQAWIPIHAGFGCTIWLDGNGGEQVHHFIAYYLADQQENINVKKFLVVVKPALPESPFILEFEFTAKKAYKVLLSNVPEKRERILPNQVLEREIFPCKIEDVPMKGFSYQLDGNIGERQLSMSIYCSPPFLISDEQISEIENLSKKGKIKPLIKLLNRENRSISSAAAEALGNIGKTAIEPIFQALREDKDNSIDNFAIEAISGMGEPVEDILIRALGDNHWAVRRTAVASLGEMQSKKSVEPLMRVLSDSHEKVRACAAEALGRIGDKRAVEPLIQSLTSENLEVRREAIKALGVMGDKKAVDPLIKALRNEGTATRSIVAWALGEIGNNQAIEPLIEYLRDDDNAFLIAPEALKRITGQDFGPDHAKWEAWYEKNKGK